ncbi:MAG TPA: C-GCAxxG-C-C family protein [Ruminiclostridium sp.]|jgi:C_GCAxxG_C_C family probable redox protein|nr:C-GCAxxG-C-C family protein [Ruminiclostridium sp.]
MNKNEDAMNYFDNGCNCAQAVVMSYADELHVSKDVIERMAVAFGGGMSKAGKTCGCLTGALMVIGLKYGEDSAKVVKKRIDAYNGGKQFMKIFGETFGATDCRELIKLDLNKSDDMVQAQKHVFGTRCRALVGKTVELLESNIL